jgi:hypothetical protein
MNGGFMEPDWSNPGLLPRLIAPAVELSQIEGPTVLSTEYEAPVQPTFWHLS